MFAPGAVRDGLGTWFVFQWFSAVPLFNVENGHLLHS
jgi:hypothetical protein